MTDQEKVRDISPSHSPEVLKIREQLDSIDNQILQLLGQRRKLSTSTAQAKDTAQLPIRDASREEELLAERIRQGKQCGLDAHFVTRVFHEIIDDSVRTQQEYFQRKANGDSQETVARVAFHGIEGSYSHLAAKKYFGRSGDKTAFLSSPSFEEAVKAVESGQADYVILPIDSTTSGGFNEVYDILLHTQLTIVGEEKCKVDHCLVAPQKVPLSEIRRVYCRPQTVAECHKFLATLQDCRIEYFTESALSVKKIKEDGDPSQAAIASEEAAAMLGLVVLKKDIGNQPDGFARYVVLARKPRRVDLRISTKTSIVMATAQEPGALVRALTVFRDFGINLTKLESRPIPENPWEELFYVDFEGNIESPTVEEALRELTRTTRFIKVLGSYPSSDLSRTNVSPQTLATSSDLGTTTTPASPIDPAEKLKAEKKGYKLASRGHKPEDTIIDVKGVKIGGNHFVVMAGPCSVESYDQIMMCAKEAKEHGAQILRGGCFKPRSSPYSFQGLGLEGLDYMADAGKTYQMPIITEVMSIEDIDGIAAKADILQIGARNMQNFSLLKAIGKSHRPIMLKRGLSSSLEELLQAAEYILAQGNQQVMLCERGIKTFETATRNTLDLSAIPVLKKRTHLPVIVDPSHAAGERDLVPPLALAAKAVGAHGVIVEFHPEPEKALSDGPQALRFPQFEQMMADLFRNS